MIKVARLVELDVPRLCSRIVADPVARPYHAAEKDKVFPAVPDPIEFDHEMPNHVRVCTCFVNPKEYDMTVP
jgi:hypothetical protein